MANDGDKEETISIGKAGQFVTLTNCALQGGQIEQWEGGEYGADWKVMNAIRDFLFRNWCYFKL